MLDNPTTSVPATKVSDYELSDYPKLYSKILVQPFSLSLKTCRIMECRFIGCRIIEHSLYLFFFLQVPRIRLEGGQTGKEGTVVFVDNNQPHLICDNSFDTREASVICRMLGFG